MASLPHNMVLGPDFPISKKFWKVSIVYLPENKSTWHVRLPSYSQDHKTLIVIIFQLVKFCEYASSTKLQSLK